MKEKMQPIEDDCLKEGVVRKFEELIITGYFPAGLRLPSERELAEMLGVSRTVLREGLIELQSMGLVTMRPRSGTVVNDYIREGSLQILSSIVKYGDDGPEERLFRGLMEMRYLFEVECARLAAQKCSDEILVELKANLEEEEKIPEEEISLRVENDFRFHRLIAMASGNPVYTLQVNSFRTLYLSMSEVFYNDIGLVQTVRKYHRELVRAIEHRDSTVASEVMELMLIHGEKHLVQEFDRKRMEIQ